MTKQDQQTRLLILAAAVALGFVVWCGRLVDLRVVRTREYVDKARRQQKFVFYKPARRGDIRDVRGNLLATSIPVKTVCVDPALLTNCQAEVAQVLNVHLGLSQAELLAQFRNLTHLVTNEDHKVRVVTNHCLILEKSLPVATWTNLQADLLASYRLQCTNTLTRKQAELDARNATRSGWRAWLPGRPRNRQARLTDRDKLPLRNAYLNAVYAVDDSVRFYPNRKLAAHVLGFTTPTDPFIGHLGSAGTGAEGLERTYDDKLTGVGGWRVGHSDASRREMVSYREQDVEPRPGLNVVLTIDARVQYLIEEEMTNLVAHHSPKGVSVLAVRPATGEILALANWPTFDPNRALEAGEVERHNRAIMDSAEPGSTFKIVTITAALNDRLVTLDTPINCEHGRFLFAGRTLRDHEAYDTLTVQNVITKSSNIGTAKVAIMMGKDRLYQYIRAWGFGSRTGLPLGGETGGIVRSPDHWDGLSISRVPIGQGVAATPLQMTMAMCALANHGVLMRPMLIDHIEDEHGQVVCQYRPIPVHQIVSERAVRDIVQALRTVVAKGGTAAKAALEDYTVAGKTGTAQKPGGGGYLEGKYFASFIGFFPVDNPELCISVFIDEPELRTGYYGGQVAAPAFKRMAERVAQYLNVRPDISPLPPAPRGSVAALNQLKPTPPPGGAHQD